MIVRSAFCLIIMCLIVSPHEPNLGLASNLSELRAIAEIRRDICGKLASVREDILAARKRGKVSDRQDPR